MKMSLDKSFPKKLQKRIEKVQFEVGVLQDKEHKDPLDPGLFKDPQLGTYAGGPVRKTTRKDSGKTIGQVLIENGKRLGIDLLAEPFRKSDEDLNKFTKSFLKSAFGKESPKRVVNLLQAVVRNPILKMEYGKNKSGTADSKGFDRHLFDTGQMFKAITARIKRVG